MAAKKEQLQLNDEFARGVFASLGYGDEPPQHVIKAYLKFKRYKDVLQPGRLSPEGFAFVACLAEIDGPETPRVPRAPKKQAKPKVEQTQKVEVEDTVQESEPDDNNSTTQEEDPFGK